MMFTIRSFETRIAELFAKGHIPGFVHLYIGEEAIAAGVCANLRPTDYITSTHRGHGHCIAKGSDLGKMMAEVHGKRAGYCKGKGGSMHIADIDLGILGANGLVGGGIPSLSGQGFRFSIVGPIKSLSVFSEMVQRIRRHFMKISTLRLSGTCRWSSSVRTTSTAYLCGPKSTLGFRISL
jgi:TPP-dependent pyruvate/acetoin dehydrogenase alpha subunit